MQNISIIIPTWNEEGNIQLLVERIHKSLLIKHISYEIIFIDDHSTDKTRLIIKTLARIYPIHLFLKQGKRGKAQSLIEGFSYAKYELFCMIDADLQYPPEAISQMIAKIESGADVVVTNRKTKKTDLIRTLISISYSFLFNKILHGLDFDVQSGLKVFRKELIERQKITAGNWAIDLELLLTAKNLGYTIVSHNIVFARRDSGGTKINLFKTSIELGWNAIKLKFNQRKKLDNTLNMQILYRLLTPKR